MRMMWRSVNTPMPKGGGYCAHGMHNMDTIIVNSRMIRTMTVFCYDPRYGHGVRVTIRRGKLVLAEKITWSACIVGLSAVLLHHQTRLRSRVTHRRCLTPK